MRSEPRGRPGRRAREGEGGGQERVAGAFLSGGLLPQICVEDRRQVALAERRDDAHDGLALVLRASCELLGRPHGGARRDAAHDALLRRQLARGRAGVLIGDLHHLVDKREVSVPRHKASADALDLVGPLVLPTREHRTAHRLERDKLALRLQRFDVLRRASDRAAGADAADEDIDGAVGVRPYLRARRLAVNLRVVGVVELLQQLPLVAKPGDDLLRLLDGTAHPLGGGRQHELGAERLQHHAPLHRHRLGHRQDKLVALRRCDHRERDPRVARRGLDERRLARLDLSLLLSLGDHRVANPVLDRVARLHGLHLQQDRRVEPIARPPELEQRRVPAAVGGSVGERRPCQPGAGALVFSEQACMSCVMSSAIFGFERTPTISPSSATIWAGRARRVGARDHAIFGDLQACLHTSASCARHLERRLVQEGCAHEERGWSERGKRGREGGLGKHTSKEERRKQHRGSRDATRSPHPGTREVLPCVSLATNLRVSLCFGGVKDSFIPSPVAERAHTCATVARLCCGPRAPAWIRRGRNREFLGDCRGPTFSAARSRS